VAEAGGQRLEWEDGAKMRRLLAYAAVFLAGSWLPLIGQVAEQPPGFSLGRHVGECLVANCRIFRGVLLTRSPVPGQPVLVRVDEMIFGRPDLPKTVALRYVDPKQIVKDFDGVAVAWGVGGGPTFGSEAPATVALALEPVAGVGPGEPLLVTSNERITAWIRSLASEAMKVQDAPETISERVAMIEQSENGPLAGYLFTYLTKRLISRDLDLETSLLGRMLDSKSVPTHAVGDIVMELGVEYSSLSSGARLAVVKHFSELTQRADDEVAARGFAGLAQIEYFHEEVRTMIPPATMVKLASAYRALVRKGRVKQNRSLDALLGVNRTPNY